jgi:hypothetical protein
MRCIGFFEENSQLPFLGIARNTVYCAIFAKSIDLTFPLLILLTTAHTNRRPIARSIILKAMLAAFLWFAQGGYA